MSPWLAGLFGLWACVFIGIGLACLFHIASDPLDVEAEDDAG